MKGDADPARCKPRGAGEAQKWVDYATFLRTSTAEKFHRSVSGAVSLILTFEPAAPVGALSACIQKVSPEGVLTIWSADLRSYTFAAKWDANLPGLIGSEVEFELPAGREITRIRLTRPNIVHRVLLEPAPAAGGADPAHRKRR